VADRQKGTIYQMVVSHETEPKSNTASCLTQFTRRLQCSHKLSWVEQGLTSNSTQFRSFPRRYFYRSDDPTINVKALKKDKNKHTKTHKTQ